LNFLQKRGQLLYTRGAITLQFAPFSPVFMGMSNFSTISTISTISHCAATLAGRAHGKIILDRQHASLLANTPNTPKPKERNYRQ